MPLNKKRIFKIISAITVIFIVFFVMLIYLGFIDWKKTVITKLSSESTRFIGQEVVIEDISFNLFKGLTLKDISVRNPKGFSTGNLLHINKLYLKVRYRDLVNGMFYFDKISISFPELTLMKDKNGNVNISEKLRNFFKRKPGIKYYIREFKINSGVFDFNNDKRYRNYDIYFAITDLSSRPGTKTLIKGSVLSTDGKINLEGWAYLKDEPKTFSFSIESKDFTPDAFKDVFDRYKINIEELGIKLNLIAEGDTENGAEFSSTLLITDAQTDFLKETIENIRIETDGLFDIKEKNLSVNRFSFKADYLSDVNLEGMISDLDKKPSYSVDIKINRLDISVLRLLPELKIEGIIKAKGIHVEGNFEKKIQRLSGDIHCLNCTLKSDDTDIKTKKEKTDTSSNSERKANVEKIPYKITSGDIDFTFKGTRSPVGINGKGVMDAEDIFVSEIRRNRDILKNTVLRSEVIFKGEDATFEANTQTDKIETRISGTIRRFFEQDRAIEIRAHIPEIKVSDIRDSFWDVFPDSFLYTGLDGFVSSEFCVNYQNSGLEVKGDLDVQDFVLRGENGEYAIGPVNGKIPIFYNNNADKRPKIQMPSFNKSNFEVLNNNFSQEMKGSNYNRITIGSVNYGFNLLEDIKIWIGNDMNTLNVKRFQGRVFGGRLSGSAMLDFSDGVQYSLGTIIKGLSLTKLCEGIEPIRGFLSGVVDGVLFMKGSGMTLSRLIGRADFWTYSTEQEETEISKEFLRKVGGSSLKTSLRDRSFDKGIMSIYLKDGYIIFHELEIENRNFLGMKDLSVKVAPLNNRISIDHLMWTMAEAAQRLKE